MRPTTQLSRRAFFYHEVELQPDEKCIQSPITLYVDEIDFRPNMDFRERVTVVDLELTDEMAMNFVREVIQRANRNENSGAMRVRFKGRLVLG